ncbi:MAG TPA: adenosylmethionine decarboxylase [Caldilineae bacterium]|nr:adenosylmethionine decarboxylase [Caldilineae bacterium]
MEKVFASRGELLGTAERIVLGKHLIVELWTRDPHVLDDPTHLRESLLAAARRGGFTVVDVHFHEFSPHGVTGVVLLAESHMSIHTWPEYGYAAVDVFACSGDPWAAMAELKERLHAEHVEIRELDRGVLG